MPPSNLIDSLQNLRRRMKVFGVMYGAGIVVACAVGLLLAVVLLDWALGLPTPLRLAVNLAALGALAYALYHWVAREAMKKLPLTDLAGRLEHHYPEFEDTVRSTVDFVRPSRGVVPGSEMMKQRTIAEAVRRAGQVNLNSAVVLRPVWYSAAAGAGALLLISSLVFLADKKFPEFLRIATNHLLGGGEPWPKTVEIDMIGQVPQRVAVGQHIDLKMRLKKGGNKQAVVKYRFDNGPWQNEVMDRADDGTYSAGLDARIDGNKDLSKLQIRLEAGDDQRDINVDVVPRLDIKSVEAMVTPPAYSEMPAFPVNIAERPVVTVVGSDIDLSITFNKPLEAAKGVRLETVEKGHAAPAVTWKFPREGVAVAHFAADEKSFKPNDPFKFTIHAADQDGFENMGSQEFSVIVHDDSLPTVQIEEPRRPEDRTPEATVPLKAVAEDDYGIDVAQLVVNRLSGGPATRPSTRPVSAAPQHWVIELHNKAFTDPAAAWTPGESSTERKRFQIDFAWELSKLANANLQPGDQIEFYVQVKDNFNLNGLEHPFVPSNKLRLAIISQDQYQNKVEALLNEMKQEIGAIKKNQDLVRDDNVTQAKETAAKQKFDDARRGTVARLATQQSTAASQTKQAAQKLEDLLKEMTENKSPEKQTKDVVDQVAKQLEQTSEGAMKDATSDLNKAKETKSDPNAPAPQQKQDAQKASESMESAARNQEQASKELEQAASKLDPFGGLEAQIAKMEAIAASQKKLDSDYKQQLKDALGKKPEEMTPDEKKKVDDLKKKQDELKKDTEDALNKMDAKADKMAKTDENASKAMKSAAQTGKQQGVPQKQQDSSQDMQQNQQANAQNDQKQVELGLEMILEKLKEAQRHKLEELQGKLAELLERVNELIARQATHNLDNLILQDPTGKKITDLTDQDRTDLFDWSKRDPKDPIKADLLVLTPSQEQTLRGCQDVAEKATALPDPGPSSKLTAAATKMEQAIVFLRKPQLADAYNPNQVEALKLLVEARKLIEAAKKKIDDQVQQDKEDTIKQAYVKLLERQKKIDEQTKDIDGAPKDNDGNLPFLLARLLPQLPGDQGKVADDANKLGEKLSSIGSVVYVWANKDIVSSMNEVKDELAKPATGTPTQAEQTRIEEQLDAMIKNLAQKKPDKPFESPKGGGGGGGGGKPPPPRMPTDVELRLLRDLQVAINKNTKTLDAEKDKNAHKLLALGGRQGEIRGVLDQLLQKSSKIKLDKEPDNKDQLPEEADKNQIEDQEFLKNLLDDNLGEDDVTKKIKLEGDRMARSRQRLAINDDPGQVTQEIQKRIVDGMEDLIKLAQKQQQGSGKGKGKGDPKPGDQPGGPQPGEKGQQETAKGPKSQQHQEQGTTPAGESTMSQGSEPNADLSKEIKEARENWGKLSPRERQAMTDAAGEKSFPKYEKYLKDYYRELAKKSSSSSDH
jgi:hypothetical protein